MWNEKFDKNSLSGDKLKVGDVNNNFDASEEVKSGVIDEAYAKNKAL